MEVLNSAPLLSTAKENVDPSTCLTAPFTAIYFSAHWCPPCRSFTPVLSMFYEEANKDGKQIEIVFVSSDQNQASFEAYFGEMPWKAVPFGDERVGKLKSQFNVTGIPKLVVLGKDGNVVSENGRMDVANLGVGALKKW